MFFVRATILLSVAAIFAPSIGMAATLDDCSHISKLRIKGNEIVVCSRGDLFSAKGNIVKGDGLVIYQKTGNNLKQIRDLMGVSPTSEEVVTVETDSTRLLKITVSSSEFPAWKSVPLFEETLHFDSKSSTIRPLRKIQEFNLKDAEARFSEIDKSHDQIFKNAKKAGVDYLSFLYGDLFKLRDYAFSNPSLIETYYKKLQRLDWLDGEVAEVFSTLYAQVYYIAESKRKSHFK